MSQIRLTFAILSFIVASSAQDMVLGNRGMMNDGLNSGTEVRGEIEVDFESNREGELSLF